ncbi:carboxylesterase family protein [Stratiformator vulcanicus]|uniref:Phospholipase/Carboxylesterase n=1 Tax=Stratiformator vulcanicus TaxID=2527980 RepID=A0A517R0I3_9PLAN|nr:dienelactone hydrolase family protein [Stratiformator vulcanicus]QDT37381.1 Phospholipase/Carboxylesterase [Stratiformator vulcanicus]
MNETTDYRSLIEVREMRNLLRTDGRNYRYLFAGAEKIEPERKYPLVLFLHGSGERGDDPTVMIEKYFFARILAPEFRAKHPCFVIAPQCPADEKWTQTDWAARESVPLKAAVGRNLRAAIEVVELERHQQPIDMERIYLTGLSMGGYGAWYLAMVDPAYFAAVAPICGGGDEREAGRIAHLPIWAAHGDQDDIVPVERSRKMVSALKAAGGDPVYREYRGVGHRSWEPAYSEDDGLLEWMFRQRRTKAVIR